MDIKIRSDLEAKDIIIFATLVVALVLFFVSTIYASNDWTSIYNILLVIAAILLVVVYIVISRDRKYF